jgi:hypothetical protein
VSYAFDRSMYMPSVGLRLFFCAWMLLMIVWSASVVLEFGRKANCVGDMILCFVRCMIWLFMSVSKILAMIGRREMGR